jgi:hypothetical protein
MRPNPQAGGTETVSSKTNVKHRGPSVTLRKIVFGRTIEFILDDEHESRYAAHELSLYPDAPQSTASDLRITDTFHRNVNPIAVNPSVHTEYEDGFAADFGNTLVAFFFRNGALSKIEYVSRRPTHGLRSWMEKARSRQYTTNAEAIGQRLHELVLVPASLLMGASAALHAAALKAPDGEALIVGGTGGVGKTTAQLNLCIHHAYRFMADDITIVDGTGRVWPNYAYPKIYNYNLARDAAMAGLVMRDRGPVDRMHWHLYRLLAPRGLRRRLSPDALSSPLDGNPSRLGRYVILMRSNVEAPTALRIPVRHACRLSAEILHTEYGIFFRHLRWHAFNRWGSGRDPFVTVETLMSRWCNLCEGALAKADCELVFVPHGYAHEQYLNHVIPLLAE